MTGILKPNITGKNLVAYFQKRELKCGGISWMARVRVKGFPPAVATFPKLSEAKIWAEQIQQDYRLGRYSKELLAKKYTAGQMIDHYLDNVIDNKSKKIRYIKNQRQQLLWRKREVGKPRLVTELREGLDELAKHLEI